MVLDTLTTGKGFRARRLHRRQGDNKILGGAVMALEDKTLVCRDCGNEFVFTTGEQEFYLSRGLENEPSRCTECRSSRRRERQDSYNRPRQMYTVTCASCGQETTVPFEPREGRPVYCRECYAKQKSSS